MIDSDDWNELMIQRTHLINFIHDDRVDVFDKEVRGPWEGREDRRRLPNVTDPFLIASDNLYICIIAHLALLSATLLLPSIMIAIKKRSDT
jgi:hypothetical protein